MEHSASLVALTTERHVAVLLVCHTHTDIATTRTFGRPAPKLKGSTSLEQQVQRLLCLWNPTPGFVHDLIQRLELVQVKNTGVSRKKTTIGLKSGGAEDA